MTNRHLTGSASLMSLLNSLRHFVSHTTVLQNDTALALQQLNSNNLLSNGFTKKMFTTLMWVCGYNDFVKEPLNGSGTTLNTNSIILQWENHPSSSLTCVLQGNETFSQLKKGRKLTQDANIFLLEIFTGRKKALSSLL